MRTFSIVVLKKELHRTPIDLFLLFFLGVDLGGRRIIKKPPVVAILGVRKPIKYILLYYIIVNSDFDEKYFISIVKSFLLIAFIQVPVAIAEHIIWTPEIGEKLGSGMGGSDFVTGTLPRGSSGAFALFLMSMISMLLGFSIYKKRTILFLSSLFLLIPFLLTLSGFSFFFFPFAFLFILGKNISFQLGRRFAYLLLICIAFIITIEASSWVIGYNLRYSLLNPERHVERQSEPIEESKGTGRLASIRYVYDYIKSHPYGLLFGMGPGMWSESYFSQYTSTLFAGTTASHANQIAATMSEFGILGLLLFLLMIFKIYMINNRFFSNTKDPFWKSTSFGFNGVILIFLVGSLYITIWHSDVLAFTFWSMAGMIYKTGIRKNML
jgi:hypothetical protein